MLSDICPPANEKYLWTGCWKCYPVGYNGFSFVFLFPFYCLIDVHVDEETLMAILRRTIPTCLPLYNQANIGQRDCLCLQIVWHPSRRRMAGGVLGSPPIGFITGRRASPAWMIASLQIMQMLSGFQCTYKREHGRLHLYDETCHSFALFPYLHLGIKVKPGNVTEKCHTDGVKRYRLSNRNRG